MRTMQVCDGECAVLRSTISGEIVKILNEKEKFFTLSEKGNKFIVMYRGKLYLSLKNTVFITCKVG